MVRSGAMKKVQFVELALFASVLLAAVFVPLAVSKIFKYFALLPRVEIDESLLRVLLREIRKASLQGAPAIRPEPLAGNFQVNFDSGQTGAERLLEAAARICRFLLKSG
jgi:hypothetical protein